MAFLSKMKMQRRKAVLDKELIQAKMIHHREQIPPFFKQGESKSGQSFVNIGRSLI